MGPGRELKLKSPNNLWNSDSETVKARCGLETPWTELFEPVGLLLECCKTSPF